MTNTNYKLKIAIIIPCYFEQEILPITIPIFIKYLQKLIDENKISSHSKLIFINDGSQDNTQEILEKFAQQNNLVKYIQLSRNFGHQNALLAGFTQTQNLFDAFVTIDADLQDDINAIEKMINQYKQGFEIVFGVRNNRDDDSFFKRTTANLFYKLMTFLGTNSVENHADFRLISKKVLQEFLKFSERNLFLRANFANLGFKSAIVEYKREMRIAGESKYPFFKMLNFAMNGITSFSNKPLRIIFSISFITILISFCLFLYVLLAFINGKTISGWASMIAINIFFFGILNFSIAIIAEYIAKIFTEVKNRPHFIVEKENIDD